MKLISVSRQQQLVDDQQRDMLLIELVNNGVHLWLRPLPLPAEWDTWTRQQKVDWVKQQPLDYVHSGEAIYPDYPLKEQATVDFENMPGWATWSAAEAIAYIEANVTNLATAKAVMEKMAQAIIYLRDVVIER